MLLVLGPLLAATPPDALGTWHTRYAILGTTGTYDFFRRAPECLVGVPREEGEVVLRCGGHAVPDPGQAPPSDLLQVTARATGDKRHGWAAKESPAWVGAWREVTLLEFVPTRTEGVHGGLAAQGAAAFAGASGVYGWRKVQPPSLAEARWIDWRPPELLDGTFVGLGSRADPRYAAAAAELDAAVRATVDRFLAGEVLPTGPGAVPGGPLPGLPQTRLAAEVVVFMQTAAAELLRLPWDFREFELPVALLDGQVRFEVALPGSAASLLVTFYPGGAMFELGASGPPCEPTFPPASCDRPEGTADRAMGSLDLPLRWDGARAGIDGEIRVGGVVSDGPLGAPHGVGTRLSIIAMQVEPAETAWRGAEPVIAIAPGRPRPPSRRSHGEPPPPSEAFAAPASASLSGKDGRWQARVAPSVFPLRLQVEALEPVMLESAVFYGEHPPLPGDEAPGPSKVVDARGLGAESWSWQYTGERPRWVRLRWRTGDHLLATAILPV